MKAPLIVLALLLAAPACAARFLPVPGAWNGKSVDSAPSFTLNFDSVLSEDGGIGGSYFFSSGPAAVKGAVTGKRLRDGVYALSIMLPAGTSIPEFGLLFPEPQYINGTLDFSVANPSFEASFAAFPDMRLSAVLSPSSNGKSFSARWSALGRGGNAQFAKGASPSGKRQPWRAGRAPKPQAAAQTTSAAPNTASVQAPAAKNAALASPVDKTPRHSKKKARRRATRKTTAP